MNNFRWVFFVFLTISTSAQTWADSIALPSQFDICSANNQYCARHLTGKYGMGPFQTVVYRRDSFREFQDADYIIRESDFGGSLEQAKPLLAKFCASMDNFKDIKDAVKWLNTSTEPYHILIRYLKRNYVDKSLNELLPYNLGRLSEKQLRELALTDRGRKIKMKTLKLFYPNQIPKRWTESEPKGLHTIDNCTPDYISDDGRIVISVNTVGDLNEIDKNPSVLMFYKDGKIIKSYTRLDIAQDTKNYFATVSHNWVIHSVKFDSQNLNIQRMDGGWVRFDLNTGEVVSRDKLIYNDNGLLHNVWRDRSSGGISIPEKPSDIF